MWLRKHMQHFNRNWVDTEKNSAALSRSGMHIVKKSSSALADQLRVNDMTPSSSVFLLSVSTTTSPFLSLFLSLSLSVSLSFSPYFSLFSQSIPRHPSPLPFLTV